MPNKFLPTLRNACKVWVVSLEAPSECSLLLHGTTRTTLMRREEQDIGNGRTSTETFGAGHQSCTMVVPYKMQIQQLLTAAATETAEMKMILNTPLMQPCAGSPRQVPTLRVCHLTQLQLQHSWNVLMALSTAVPQMKLQWRETNCHQNCIHSHCTDGPVTPHMYVVYHSLLDLPLRQTRNWTLQPVFHICNMYHVYNYLITSN